MTVRFKEWDTFAKGFYYLDNMRKAIILLELHDDLPPEPIAKATTNLPDEPCEENEVFVKDYSENEGMTEALIDAGIIHERPTNIALVGPYGINKYKLTEKALNTLWKP